MATNAQIITAVARAVSDPDFQQRSGAIYAQILTDAMDFIIDSTECMRKSDTSLTLVAGTQEYNLPTRFIKFPSMYSEVKTPVALGTDGKITTIPSSVILLNQLEVGWRGAADGTPQYHYLILEGTAKVGFHPAPSSSFISTYGSSVYLDMVFRSEDIADNSSSPFDSSTMLRSLQFLLKLRALWQIRLENKEYSDADRYDKMVKEELERAKEFVESIMATPGEHGFVQQFGGSV